VSLLVVTHPVCERHLTGPGHPERPQRLIAVRRAIDEAGLDDLTEVRDPETVDRELLEQIHRPDYIKAIGAMAAAGGGWIDADTAVSANSADAAARAAGAAQHAARALCNGEARAFVAVRPPGHHALPDRGMGFCLYNNAAIAAAEAQRRGRRKILLVDWDVHHGNGTQAAFWRDPTVLFVSLHQEYWYPGTGLIEEIGEGPGEGFTVNVPLPAETGIGGYEDVWTEVVLPLMSAFGPDFLIISAGYDAHRDDPLGGMVLSADGFGRLTSLLDAAARPRSLPMMGVLEGGYDLAALGDSVAATVRAMTGRPDALTDPAERAAETPRAAIASRVRAVRRSLLSTWRI
jgi:acetoin utilization deacetylase AcuC-like enzyme